MTNINRRDGSEDLRAVSKRFRSCFRNSLFQAPRWWRKREKRAPKKSEGAGERQGHRLHFSRSRASYVRVPFLIFVPSQLSESLEQAISETTRNWKKIREGRKLQEDNFKYPTKNRIPQVLRISQYRNFRSELPKYRMKNWPLPQYRKPQCPPPLSAPFCNRLLET